MTTIPNFLPYLSAVFAVCLVIGGFFAFRYGYSQQAGKIEERVISALTELNKAQEKEIKALKRDNVAMRAAFKQLGVEIEIDGDTITIINGQQPKRTRIVQVPGIEENT
jgi:hypothetical protein